ncbi:YwhD family protein [Paenibacillus sp. UNCCL117]|uniref:YwhD family protein n=1 Tax=unclassified Paenibacillus TaxID=185978 RepID=UPI00088B50AB|nr:MULTISPECIES: YwhD family protein [unclassified Paenibacillus]SDD19055.1 YwhD family protein [Paenibacillus sp. cl123]SFW35401.1 YwhD family protein [Paenibacillus sp. UNCCL117]
MEAKDQNGQPAAGADEKKKLPSLNIISNKETKHRGFGQGAIDLSQLSSVIIDGDEVYLDAGALHAKSKVEKGIKFLPNKDEVPEGRTCWIVWVAVDFREDGKYYAGVTSCEMTVNPEARRGWKVLADHVNRMDYALKRRILVDNLGAKEKELLRKFLIDNDSEMWERSDDALKAALA